MNLQQLYDTDGQQWLTETIHLLKQGQFSQLDLEHLVEELEYLGRSERNAVESLLEQILRHLLLLHYWQEERDRNANHWEAEIIGFRGQLHKYLTTNLRQHLAHELNSIYQSSLKYVRRKTANQVAFPPDCPYTLEDLLSDRFF